MIDVDPQPGVAHVLDQAFAVSNLFLKKGQLVVYTRGRIAGSDQDYVAKGDRRTSAALVVLAVFLTSAWSKHTEWVFTNVPGAARAYRWFIWSVAELIRAYRMVTGPSSDTDGRGMHTDSASR